MKKVLPSLAVVIVLALGLLSWSQNRTLAPARTLHVQGGAVTPLFSPDGKTLAVLTNPNVGGQAPYYNLELWDVATWQRKRILPRVKFFLAFSQDSRTLFAAEDSVQQWDVATGRLIHTYGNVGYLVNYSGDRRYFATMQLRSGSPVTVWDTAKQKPWHVLTMPRTYEVNYGYAKFSPEDNLLAAWSCHPAKELTLWNVGSGTEVTNLRGRTRRVQEAAFSHDGSLLATRGQSQPVTVWDTHAWQPIRTFPTDLETVRDLRFSPSGTRLFASGEVATGSANSLSQKNLQDSLTLWDVQTGEVLLHFSGQYGTSLSRDGRYFVTHQGYGINLWETQTGKRVAAYGGKQTPVIYETFSADDHLLATTGVDRDDRVTIWPVTAQ